MRSTSLTEDLEQRCAKLRVVTVLSPHASDLVLLRASLLLSLNDEREGLVLLRPKTKGVISTCTVQGSQTAQIGSSSISAGDQVWLLEWHSVTLLSGEEALLSNKYAVVHSFPK